MSVQQLALWAEPVPETVELPFSWADGDTCLAQLERLALLVTQNIQVARDDSGRGHCFKVVATRIEDGRVIGTGIEVWPWGKRDDAVPDDEEEDC